MKILQITSHFSPNVGGVETHLDDLVKALKRKGYRVGVLTYRPLTSKVPWRMYEQRRNLWILRLPWLPGLFYKLVRKPALEFLYLVPPLFFIAPFVVLFFKPKVIHAHGLVAGFVSVFWGRVFGKRTVLSTHSIYHFPVKGLYRRFVEWLFKRADYVMGLSKQAAIEIGSLGIPKRKIGTFTYWIDLKRFKRIMDAKSKLGWDKKFIVLFVGRLVPEKGIPELLKAAQTWNKAINLVVAGSGPMEEEVSREKARNRKIDFIGRINNKDLPIYYSAADILIVPSTHEEGFGRVILEALACGTPVVGSNRGAIPEAMDETVGRLIDVTPKNIRGVIEYFYNNPDKLEKLSRNARKFTEKKYGEKNVGEIIKTYR